MNDYLAKAAEHLDAANKAESMWESAELAERLGAQHHFEHHMALAREFQHLAAISSGGCTSAQRASQ